MKKAYFYLLLLFTIGCTQNKESYTYPIFHKSDIVTSIGSYCKYKVSYTVDFTSVPFDTLTIQIVNMIKIGDTVIIYYQTSNRLGLIDTPIGVLTNDKFALPANLLIF